MATNNQSEVIALLPPPATIDDTHKVYSVIVGCIIMCLAGTATVLLRLYARFSSRNLGIDDYATMAALPTYIGWCALAIYANHSAGVGKPLWEITLDEYVVSFKMFVVVAFLYPIMSTAIRIAVLLFYHRMFAVSTSNFKKVNYVFIGLQAVYLIVYIIVPIFTCNPVYAAWTLELYPYKCNPTYFNNITTSLYSVSLVYDVAMTALPLWPVLRLQVPLAKRIKIALLFLLGMCAVVAAAYKLAVWAGSVGKLWDGDPIWFQYQLSSFIPPQFANFGVTFWIPSTLEPTIAMICASIPALQPILVKWGRAVGLKVSSVTGTSKQTEPSEHSKSLPQSRSVKARTPQVYQGNEGGSDEELYGEYIALGRVSGVK